MTALEDWARAYIESTDLSYKLAPPPAPPAVEGDATTAVRLTVPGRPKELRPLERAEKAPRPGALAAPAARARLFHTLLHHELQAAELMCWALLAFPRAPLALRRGLVRVFGDEIRHMGLYRQHLEGLACEVGAHPVRDWFWQRLPACQSPAQFVATMGVGLEGANLDHAARFGQQLRAVGDTEGAAIQDVVRTEEVSHVAFALHWLRALDAGDAQGSALFERWAAQLPEPLSPWVFRATPVNRADRERAGLDAAFLDRLEAFQEKDRAPRVGAEPRRG